MFGNFSLYKSVRHTEPSIPFWFLLRGVTSFSLEQLNVVYTPCPVSVLLEGGFMKRKPFTFPRRACGERVNGSFHPFNA